MRQDRIARDSSEYAEIIAEVFVETVRNAEWAAMLSKDEHEDITPALMECLNYLYLHGASPVGSVASGLGVTLSAASQLVDRLVKKSLAGRRENESDRRLTLVELSQDGMEIAQRMRHRRSAWFASVVDSLPASSRMQLIEGLESFLKVALAQDGDAGRVCDRCGMEHVPFCVVNKVKHNQFDAG